MFQKKNFLFNPPKFIKFYGFELEEVTFRKIEYSPSDHSVYIVRYCFL